MLCFSSCSRLREEARWKHRSSSAVICISHLSADFCLIRIRYWWPWLSTKNMLHFLTVTRSLMHPCTPSGFAGRPFPILCLLPYWVWTDMRSAHLGHSSLGGFTCHCIACCFTGLGKPIFSLSTVFLLCLQPSISGVDLDKFRQILLNHCDVNKDGKIQKSELALCLGLKMNP